jgi:serine/threonine protein kinase
MTTIMPTRTRAVERALVDERQAPSRREVAPGRVFVGVLIWVIHWKVAVPADSPTRIGPYLIRQELGRGGMGVVWAALDERLHRHVAIKALLRTEDGSQGTVLAERVLDEARALAAVSHSNVASVHDVVEQAGVWFIVMELVGDGSRSRTLRDLIGRRGLSLLDAIRIARQMLAGLRAVHQAGLFHRDLKPSNVLLTPGGDAKLADFGLSRAHSPEGRAVVSPTVANRIGASATRETDAEATGFTLPWSNQHRFSGTAGYMSPQQWKGEAAAADQDLFAFGCVLFEMLTGSRALRADEAPFAEMIDWQRLPDSTPAGVRDLLRDCLAMDSAARVKSAADLDDRLAEVERALNGWRGHVARALRHPVTLVAIATTLGFALNWFVVLNQVLPRIEWYQGLTSMPTPQAVASTQRPSAGVVVLGYRSGGAMVEAAQSLGVPHQVTPSEMESWRWVHAEVIRRLANSNAACIAFDTRFRAGQDIRTDQEIAAAIRFARSKGVPVVVGTRTWHRDEYGLPDTAPAIRDAGAAWGSMLIGPVQTPGHFLIELGVLREGLSQGNLSLGLEAVVRTRVARAGAADLQSQLTLDGSDAIVQVWRRGPIGERVREGEPIRILGVRSARLTAEQVAGPLADLGYQAGDTTIEVDIASVRQQALIDNSNTYAAIASSNQAGLTDWAAGKIVFIGALEGDWVTGADGAQIPGVITHAMAAVGLLQSNVVPEPNLRTRLIWTFAVVSCGAFISIIALRWWQRVVIFGMLSLIIGSSAWWMVARGESWNVGLPFAAMVVGISVGAMTRVLAKRACDRFMFS